jgi:hypothetical protein
LSVLSVIATAAVGEERGAGTGCYPLAGRAAAGPEGVFIGFNFDQGSSGCPEGFKKRKTGGREVAGGWNTKVHAIVASGTLIKGLRLSAGNVSDATEGRLLREMIGPLPESAALLMDRAYEDELTRLTA